MALIRRVDEPGALDEAVLYLRQGKLVIFPTDTVYGVGAAGLDAMAIEKLFEAKVRAREKAIPLLLADADDVGAVARKVSRQGRLLMERYWPGPLTIVVSARLGLPPSLTANGTTVAVRVPDCTVTRELIRRLGSPLAATSANLSGKPAAQTASQAAAALGDRVALVLDDGPTPSGEASTVVDVTRDPPQVLRAGALANVPEFQALLSGETRPW